MHTEQHKKAWPSWSIKTLFLIGCALSLTACSGLDHQKIAQDIQQDIVRNGGVTLKAVNCPRGIQPKAGESFECVGQMSNGYTFAIAVQQKDDQGSLSWDVPHAKGLVNVSKLETSIQESLVPEIGVRPSIACGGVYKVVSPGEGFECQISYKATQPASQTKSPRGTTKQRVTITQVEKISVATDPDGNVLWQRVPSRAIATPSKS